MRKRGLNSACDLSHSGNFGTALRQIATALLLILPCDAQSPPGVLYSINIPNSDGPLGSAYLGAITVDASGNTYITGGVLSNGLTTTPGVFQRSAPAGGAAFVAKLDPTGAVVFLTYLGGSFDSGSSILVDPTGHIYVGGTTASSVFPLAGSPYRPPLTGGPFAFTFIAELSGDGKTLIWSTLLNETQPQLALGPDGSLYDFAVTQLNISYGVPEARALTKLTGAGGFVAHMVVPTSTSTLAVGPDGSVYIGGGARPGDITATPGAWQTTFEGSREGFVAKVNDTLSGYAWATYTGEQSSVLQLKPVADGASLWVSGAAPATLPVTPGALQSQPGPNFLVRLSSDGSQAITATYLPSGLEILALDASGNLLIESGYGGIFQATPGAPWPCETSPVFIGTIDAAAQHVLGGTSLPATLPAQYVAAGNIANTVIAYDNSSTGGLTLTAINGTSVSPHLATFCIAPSDGGPSGPLAPGELFSIYGAAYGPVQGVVAQPSGGTIGTSLGGIQVTVEGTPVPLLYVSAAQINAVAPFLLNGRTAAHVKVVTPSGTSNEVVLGVREVVPEVFAISNQDGTQNSQTNPAHAGDYLTIWTSGMGQTKPPGVDGAIPIAAGGTPLLPITLQLATVQSPNLEIPGPTPPPPVSAQILYAGNAPGLVSGVTQINFEMPELSYPIWSETPIIGPPYAAYVTITIGGASVTTYLLFE